MVYASHLGMVVLLNAGLGGATKPAASTPTRIWGWTGTEWRLLDQSGPPIRNLAGVTYDTQRHVVVMHGGTYDLGQSYGETWEWSGTWRRVTGPGPGIRDHTQLAFDRQRGRAVLFGGSGADPNVGLSDTWEYDGTVWTQVATDGPPGRVHHAMHFDPLQNLVVLAAGNVPGSATVGDTWTWDGSRWTAAGSLPPRSHMRMTFDAGLGALVMVGGSPSSSGIDLLVRNGASWSRLTSATEPSPRILTDAAFDEARGVLVLFGGADPTGSLLYDDTWEFDGVTWRRVD